MDYINKPHLIGGIKYDLRLYVLISSFDPLRIYMYNDGLVRFATEKYSLLHRDLCKRFVHLTNFSVNKKSPAFIKNRSPGEDNIGQKWSHKALRKQFDLMGLDYDATFDSIKDVVVKTCIATEPFMLDSNAKGNSSP